MCAIDLPPNLGIVAGTYILSEKLVSFSWFGSINLHSGEEMVEEPFQRLITEKKMIAHRHLGFWAAIDTFKDKRKIDNMFASANTPWMFWK